MQLAEPRTYTNCTRLMLVLQADGTVGTLPWPYELTFHSDDPAQLAKWLRNKRGPTCPNDVALVDAVQAEIESAAEQTKPDSSTHRDIY